MAAVLRSHGYVVTVLSDEVGKVDDKLRPAKANIERELKAVMGKTRKGDLLLLAFTGHGVQFEDQKDCFFCPTDARPFKDRTDSLLSLTKVYEEMERSFAEMKVLLVDACRNDPSLKGVKSGIDADSSPRPPQGVAALFSCRAGEMSREHDDLKHGVFFYHVLEGLRGAARNPKGNVTFAGLAAYVSEEVPDWVAKKIGEGAKQSPNLKADYSTEPVLLRAELPKQIENSIGMKLTLIPSGTFTMGSSKEEQAHIRMRFGEEAKDVVLEEQHEVEITRPFYIGVYEVTQEEYEKVTGKNPSGYSAAGRHKDRGL